MSDLHFQLFVRRQTAQVRQDPRRSRVKEYPRAQFAWDLATLLEDPSWLHDQAGEIVLHPASDSAARSRATSVLIRRRDSLELAALGDLQVR